MLENRLWKIFFYLSLTVFIMDLSNTFEFSYVYSIITKKNIFLVIIQELSINIAIYVVTLICAYFKFKPVLFYNLYSFPSCLSLALRMIRDYEQEYAVASTKPS